MLRLFQVFRLKPSSHQVVDEWFAMTQRCKAAFAAIADEPTKSKLERRYSNRH